MHLSIHIHVVVGGCASDYNPWPVDLHWLYPLAILHRMENVTLELECAILKNQDCRELAEMEGTAVVGGLLLELGLKAGTCVVLTIPSSRSRLKPLF